jgi:iron complex outermembrane receptor protein
VGLNGVKFTAGVRHSWDKRDGDNTVTPAPGHGVPPGPPQVGGIKYDKWSWTLGLEYQMTQDTLFYVTSRHSYKAGGVNLVSTVIPAALFLYRPETLTDIEIGAKTTVHLGESTIRANVAAYRAWYKDLHQQELANCGQVSSYVINAGNASPKGVEFEFDASLTRNVRVNGFFNVNLGKFDTFSFVSPAGCSVIGAGAVLAGKDMGRLSKNSAGLTATYTLPLKGVGEAIEVTGNWYYRSHKVGDATAGNNTAIPGYSLFNARIDYNNIGGSPFSAGFWVKNLTDKLYSNYRNDTLALSGYAAQTYGDPRTFGIDVKYKF